MFKVTLKEIFYNPKLWQAIVFSVFQVAGLAAYGHMNQIASYGPAHVGQLIWLSFFEFMIFTTFYLILNRKKTTLLTERLALLLTMICWLIGILTFPAIISTLTGLTVLVLTLMSFGTSLLSNEWGLFTAAILLGLNSINFFFLNHQYLSTDFLKTLFIPALIYIFFLASLFETPFVLGVEFLSAVTILVMAFSSGIKPLFIILDGLLLAGWLYCLMKLSMKKSHIAVLAGLLAALMLFFNG